MARKSNGLSRAFGLLLMTVFMGGALLASLLLLVAVIAGLWRFIGWAIGG